MGDIYFRAMFGKRSGTPGPRVGLLSIGEEEAKGNQLTREAFQLLKQLPLNFIGNVEGRDLYNGKVDVIVADGFVGNVALKISEGVANLVRTALKESLKATITSQVGALLSRSAFIEDPEVLGQYLSGAVSWERVVEVMDSVISVLTQQEFTPASALAAWDAVGSLAVGSAVAAIRYHSAVESGHPPKAEWHRVLGQRPVRELVGARAVVGNLGENLEAEFEEEMTTLLVGIAARRGESWEAIVSQGTKGRQLPTRKLAAG